MGRSKRRIVAKLVLAGWLLAAESAHPLAGETHSSTGGGEAAHVDGAEASGSSAAAVSSATVGSYGCPTQLSCGYQCVAQLTVSFCIRLIKFTGGLKFGGLEVGPNVSFQCQACDCWYIGPGPNGRVFQRTVRFSCAGSSEGLTLQ